MNDPRKPQRMGLIRKLTGMPSLEAQTKALETDGCLVIWTYAEFPHAMPSFMSGDTVVALDARAFGKHAGDFQTKILEHGLHIPRKKTGPKTKLPPIGSKEWAAISYNWGKTQPKEQHAVGVALAMGYKVNDDQIRYQFQKEAKAALIDPAAIDEGKDE